MVATTVAPRQIESELVLVGDGGAYVGSSVCVGAGQGVRLRVLLDGVLQQSPGPMPSSCSSMLSRCQQTFSSS